MNFDIAGKTALVLGAGGGLGGAIAAALAAEGVKVVAADIDKQAANVTAERLRAKGGECLALQWDLANLSVIDERIREIEAHLGPVDILVNNTGGPPPTPASGQPTERWMEHFQSMVASVIAITDAVLPGMRERKWGRIITSTSSGVVSPIPNLGISNALRSALVGWSKTLAREVGADGVTCNIILPGRIATGRILYLDEQKALREGKKLEQVVADSTASIALGRYGRPEEYADAVAFLSSARAGYITGSITRIDGGLISSI